MSEHLKVINVLYLKYDRPVFDNGKVALYESVTEITQKNIDGVDQIMSRTRQALYGATKRLLLESIEKSKLTTQANFTEKKKLDAEVFRVTMHALDKQYTSAQALEEDT